ncbi:MAG: hypothetical protein ACI9SC_003221, partial [Gammaproteobacteria bacterium]
MMQRKKSVSSTCLLACLCIGLTSVFSDENSPIESKPENSVELIVSPPQADSIEVVPAEITYENELVESKYSDVDIVTVADAD